MKEIKIKEIRIEATPANPCREEFKKWMCRHFHVETVDDLPFDVKTYCDFMECFEAGWYGREQKLIDKMLTVTDQEIKENEWVFAARPIPGQFSQSQCVVPAPQVLEQPGTKSPTDVYCRQNGN